MANKPSNKQANKTDGTPKPSNPLSDLQGTSFNQEVSSKEAGTDATKKPDSKDSKQVDSTGSKDTKGTVDSKQDSQKKSDFSRATQQDIFDDVGAIEELKAGSKHKLEKFGIKAEDAVLGAYKASEAEKITGAKENLEKLVFEAEKDIAKGVDGKAKLPMFGNIKTGLGNTFGNFFSNEKKAVIEGVENGAVKFAKDDAGKILMNSNVKGRVNAGVGVAAGLDAARLLAFGQTDEETQETERPMGRIFAETALALGTLGAAAKMGAARV